MKNKPLISIITVTYNLIKNNRKDYIIQNINSVHNQTYENIEHIIIDGASDDGTLELLKPYEEKGWIKIYSEPDNGIYDAMNKGILKSTGEYIVCLNSDDFYYINNAVELEINKIKSDNADLCYANSYVINENDQNQNYIWKGKETFHPLFGTFANHQTLMVKKETLIEHGLFDLDLPTCADNVYMLDMVLKNKKITYLDETIIGFRNNGWSCTIQEQAVKDYLEHFYNTYGKQTGLTFDDCYQCNCKRYLYLSLQDIEKLGNKIVREDWKREYFEEYEKYKNENTNTDTNTDTNTNDTDTNSNTDTNTKTNKRTKKYILLGFIPIYKSVKDDYSTKRYILEIPYSSWQNKGEYIVTRTFFQMFKKKKSSKYSKYYFLGIQFWNKKKNKIGNLKDCVYGLQKQIETLTQKTLIQNKFNQIYACAHETHSKVFPKYRNCNKGKEMVILASGPTLDYYNLHQNALYLGVNRSFVANKADLDYIFVQDYDNTFQVQLDEYRKNECQKFYGVHYLVPSIAQCHADITNAERYYFIDCDFDSVWAFPPDISILPFNTYSSVIHPAVVFALWTGVSKIYLVGCDTCGNGHANCINNNGPLKNLCVDNIYYGWQKMKEYVANFYPETEIISINPVGLKGLFKDVYTADYIEDNPTLKQENIVIIGEN